VRGASHFKRSGAKRKVVAALGGEGRKQMNFGLEEKKGRVFTYNGGLERMVRQRRKKYYSTGKGGGRKIRLNSEREKGKRMFSVIKQLLSVTKRVEKFIK